MLERIVAPRPRVPAEATPPLLASAAVHLALALLAAGVLAHASGVVGEQADERAMLLLPLLPSAAPPEAEVLAWEGGTTPGDAIAVDAVEGSGRGDGSAAGSGRRLVRQVPGTEIGPEEGGGLRPVYAFDAVLDRPVTRHPEAGSPEYPPALLARRVEGWVSAEFTVDTTGHADSASVVILEATHPEFEASLRAAMPRLRFIPAEHMGQRVRQRVAQKYFFRVELVDSVRTAS